MAPSLPELTVVDEADGRHGLEPRAGPGGFGLLKAVGQATQEVLPLLVEAQPQVELQLSLHRPARRPEPLLPGELRRAQRTRSDEG